MLMRALGRCLNFSGFVCASRARSHTRRVRSRPPCPAPLPNATVCSLSAGRSFRGEAWRRLRQDDLSQVDFGATGGALVGLIRGLLRAEPGARVDADALWAHAVVARTRAAVDRAGALGVSPLAPVPEGFLAEVLGDDGAPMDCCA
jgi:hypothetical protein